MESFEFFVEGGGGFGVVNVADEHELQQMMIEYPFSAFDTQMMMAPVALRFAA